jgi:uridine kinase
MICNNSILIGIAGGTGSGKTSIAKKLCSNFKESDITLIEQDAYYKDLSHISLSKRELVNFDHPDSIDFLLMQKQIIGLINGIETNIPIYNFKTHTRKKNKRSIKAKRIIILEGILALFNDKIRNMMDIKIYVDTPNDIRIIRRIKRDIEERKRTLSSIIKQYYDTVRPMHLQFVEPTKDYADIIIPKGSENKIAIDILNSKIKDIINNNLK